MRFIFFCIQDPSVVATSNVEDLVPVLTICEPCNDVEPDETSTGPALTNILAETLEGTPSTHAVVTVGDISPLPRITSEGRKRVPEKSKVLTSTPVKNEILGRKKLKAATPTGPRKRTCRGEKKDKVTKNFTQAVTTKRVTKRKLLAELVSQETEYKCIYCDDKFVDPPAEPWSQCSVCLNWCHESCVLHMKPPFPVNFACVNCMPKRRRR